MNIFMKFEDKYGCCSLFNYSNSILLKNSASVDILGDFCCNDVFSISRKDLDSYDFIILVFDMDNSEEGDGALTFNLLQNRLIKASEINCVEDDFGKTLRSKLILIPVFFCFETIPLFSHILQSYLLEISGLKSSQSLELLNLFRSHYDICSENPEVFKNILCESSKNSLDSMRTEVKNITGNVAKNWTVQKFYASYYKEFLRSKFSKFNEKQNGFSFFTKEDKSKMKKNSDYVFKTLVEHNCLFNPHEILHSFLNTECEFNTYLQWLYSVQDLKELKVMTYECMINDIEQKIIKYNNLLKGISNQINDNKFSKNQSIVNEALPANAFL